MANPRRRRVRKLAKQSLSAARLGEVQAPAAPAPAPEPEPTPEPKANSKAKKAAPKSKE